MQNRLQENLAIVNMAVNMQFGMMVTPHGKTLNTIPSMMQSLRRCGSVMKSLIRRNKSSFRFHVLLWRRRIVVCRKDWPWYVISFMVSIKISTRLTKIRNIGVLSLRHGRNSGV
jgi:hypothetical protein